MTDPLPSRPGTRWKNINPDVVNARIAAGASRKEIIKEFGSEATLRRRGIDLPPYPKSAYQRRFESRIIAASLFARAGASLGEIVHATKLSKSTLLRYNIHSQYVFGESPRNRPRAQSAKSHPAAMPR